VPSLVSFSFDLIRFSSIFWSSFFSVLGVRPAVRSVRALRLLLFTRVQTRAAGISASLFSQLWESTPGSSAPFRGCLVRLLSQLACFPLFSSLAAWLLVCVAGGKLCVGLSEPSSLAAHPAATLLAKAERGRVPSEPCSFGCCIVWNSVIFAGVDPQQCSTGVLSLVHCLKFPAPLFLSATWSLSSESCYVCCVSCLPFRVISLGTLVTSWLGYLFWEHAYVWQ
jgi:hypothetical protein